MKSLEDRMKHNYESPSQFHLTPRLPTIIRLDGKCFHTLSKKLKWAKPFDNEFRESMGIISKHLCREIMNVKLAYTYSDEISLLLVDYDRIETEGWFGGEIQKIVSVSAGMASAKASILLETEVVFDSRVFVIPPWEVCNYFIWRQQDCVRNSIQSVAQANFSHKSLYGLSCDQLQEKLFLEKRINWAKLPIRHKRGSMLSNKMIFGL